MELNTVQDLVKRVHFAIANTSTVDSALEAEIKAALHWTMRRMIAQVDHPAFRVEADLSLQADVRDYDLEADFQRMIEPGVRLTETPFWTLYPIDQQDFDRQDGSRYNQRTRPTHYSIIGKDQYSGLYQIRFYPMPDAVYPIRYRYFAYSSPIINASANQPIDRRFPRDSVDGLVYGAALHFTDYLSPDKRDMYGGLYREAIQAMTSKAEPFAGRVRRQRGGLYRTPMMEAAWPDRLSGTDLPSL